MPFFTNAEYADMHLMYGLAEGNAAAAVRLYQERFPQRRLPNRLTFEAVDRRLRQDGRIQPAGPQPRARAIPEAVEDEVLTIFEDEPESSTRQVGRRLGVNHTLVWKILRSHRFHPFHVQKVQGLNPADYPRRTAFCQWFLAKVNDIDFPRDLLVTDEANFSRDGIINLHNKHQWSQLNPHATCVRSHQVQFSLNVWCGIVGDNLIGPYFLEPRLNGVAYLQFLRDDLPELLEDVPLGLVNRMWFMHDGAPPHFSIAVRNYLNATFPLRWLGRGGPVEWPARSPDLNPCDFFLWGHLKDLVYQTEVPDVEELRRRIIHGCQTIRETPGIFQRVRESFVRRANVCLNAGGEHFEQFL